MANVKAEQRDLGKAVLARIAKETALAAPLKALVRAFAARQKSLEAAAKTVLAARAARDAALTVVASADAALDRQVDVLAERVLAAKLGPASNPFAPWKALPPAQLKEIAYTTEVEQVLKLVAAIKKKKPPKPLAAALTACTQTAAASKKALIALVAPQIALVEAMAEHDALLVEWTRAFERLRAQAPAAWFAPPAPDAPTPAPARRKAKPAAAVSTTDAAPPPPPAQLVLPVATA